MNGPVRRFAVAAGAWFVTASGYAHPGHGHTDANTWLHHVAEPEHIVWLGFAIVAGFLIRRIVKARFGQL